MRIALVIPTFVHGGMERVMSELGNYWAKIGWEVTVIFLVNHKPFFEIDRNVHGVIMPQFFYKPNFASKFLYSIRIILYLRRNVKRINPDSLLSFGEGYNSIVLLSTLGLNYNVFVSDRSSPDHQLGFFKQKLMKYLYPTAAGVISQTKTAKIKIQSKAALKNVHIIPNPVKIIPRANLKKENIILNVGRLVKEKNQLQLIQIFSKVCYGDWRLIIVGDGPLRLRLENEIKKLDLEEKVILAGAQYDLSVYFSKSKIFAMTSISEGYPNALCEAMAFPLPVISFNCIAGPADIINDGVNGFLIEPERQMDFEYKLSSLMRDENLRTRFELEGIKIRNIQSIDTIASNLEQIFKKNRRNEF